MAYYNSFRLYNSYIEEIVHKLCMSPPLFFIIKLLSLARMLFKILVIMRGNKGFTN